MKYVVVWLLVVTCPSLFAGAKSIVVPVAYRNVAQAHGIPYKVFFAIAMQESQRRLENGAVLPWPWTLNVGGESRYYETSEEILRDLVLLVSHGNENIDIGLMQINLKWHRHRSGSLIDLVRPEDNINIAAEILVEQYERCGESDWWCAVGRYHSYRKSVADGYSRSVRKWYELLL